MKSSFILVSCLVAVLALISVDHVAALRLPGRVKWFGLPTKYAVKKRQMQPFKAGTEQSVIACFRYLPRTDERHLNAMTLRLKRSMSSDIDLVAKFSIYNRDDPSHQISILGQGGEAVAKESPAMLALTYPDGDGNPVAPAGPTGPETVVPGVDEAFVDGPEPEFAEKPYDPESEFTNSPAEGKTIWMSENKMAKLEKWDNSKCIVIDFTLPNTLSKGKDYEFSLRIPRKMWTSRKFSESPDFYIDEADDKPPFELSWKNALRHPFKSMKHGWKNAFPGREGESQSREMDGYADDAAAEPEKKAPFQQRAQECVGIVCRFARERSNYYGQKINQFYQDRFRGSGRASSAGLDETPGMNDFAENNAAGRTTNVRTN